MQTRRTWGHYAGAVIGLLGWVIGLTIVGLVSGNTRALAEVLLPCVLASLGMGLSFVVVFESVQSAWPDDRTLHVQTLWALLSLDLGILLLLLKTWVMPLFTESERSREVMSALSATTSVPWVLVVGLLAAGSLLFLLAARRVVDGGKDPGE